jgi:hypothetical protein
MKYVRILILIVLAMHAISVHCQSVSNVRKLYTDLFTNYTKEVLPVYDHSKPLMVGVTFYLASINNFKEVEETISITGSFNFNWTDPFLAWNPSLYGNIYWTVIDSSDMWVPFMVLANNVNKMEPIGGETKFSALIFANGDVIYSPGDIFEASCPTDISKFPFDKQQCYFTFMAWAITKNFLSLSSVKDQASLDYFFPHSDWTLLEYSTEKIEDIYTNSFVFKLTIKRRALYYGVMVIAPTVLFALLNPLVFLLPIESGERVSLAMTILLSYAIFLTLVSSSIPASSNPMCALLIVMIIIIVVSGIIVLGVIITVKYFNEENEDKIGPTLKRVVMWQLPKDNDVGGPLEVKYNVTGKDVANMLDTIFFYGSYVVMILTASGYILYVFL